jgi:general stress protein 26
MLRSRPMAAIADRDGHCLWFLTDIRAHKDEEIRQHPSVNVAFADLRHNTYVSISGMAAVVRDRAKAKELWGPEQQAWFPGGPDDPDLALLKVTPEQGEIWDGTSSSVVYALKSLAAIVTGTRPDVGENKKVAM